ncbi:hypothetical protein D9619_001864 [Psilocybe cf. subviscida]|uniref:F-box domain-containing protein n=1 Tax=Psilocybe cf. subviscida TaxID=2480587 RepID=A0A8H5F317_9AGAR|nr:hypothetical protein D9619_001864 [Psilocybe cf. subviscida]
MRVLWAQCGNTSKSCAKFIGADLDPFGENALLCVVLTEYKLPHELSTLTQVSHHWRAVAINTAQLWTCIPCNNFFLREEHLKGSRTLSLDIILRLAPEEQRLLDIKSPVYVLLHLHRIEKLVINFAIPDKVLAAGIWRAGFEEAKFDKFDTFNALCKKSAPRLRHFQLTREYEIERSSAASTVYIFPGANLHYPKLYRVGISWDSHLLSSALTYLHPNDLPNDERFTPQKIRDVLKRMLGLKSLHLRMALSERHAPDLPKLEPVHLPLLKKLTTRETGSTFPGTLEVLRARASDHDHRDPVDWVRAIVDVLKDACTDWGTFWSGDIRALVVDGGLAGDTWHTRFRGSTGTGVEKLLIELPSDLAFYTYTFFHISAVLCSSGSHRIMSVSWESRSVSKAMKIDTFQRCPDLESVSVDGGLVLSLASCLRQPDLQDYTRKLVEIQIHCMLMEPVDDDDDEDGEEEELNVLMNALDFRHNSGQGIWRLTFVECEAVPPAADRGLREIVGEVIQEPPALEHRKIGELWNEATEKVEGE